MILQALYQLAEDEGLMEDPDFEWKPVSYIINLDENGNFLGFTSTHYTPAQEGKGKPKPVAKRMVVPRSGSRTSGARALFFCDKAEYVFGLDPAGKREAEKLTSRAGLFRDQVRACGAATGDPGVKAVLAFLDAVAVGTQQVELPEDCAGNDLFAFVVSPKVDQLLTQRESVRQYWKAQRQEASDGKVGNTCLILGKLLPSADKFPPIKRVPGGSTSGVGFVSFNEAAFCSYGWKRNENANVSREAAEACATALNRLLDPAYPDPKSLGETLPKRNLRLSADTVVAYWARGKPGQDACDVFSGLFDADPEAVGELYRSMWRGKAPNINDPSAFYALTLTGTQGRVVVRDWFESTVADVLRNMAQYFVDIDIVRNTPKPKTSDLPPQIALGHLLESLAVQGKSDNIPAPLSAQFVRAVLAGTPFPLSVMQRAIERTRAEIGKTDWRDLVRRDARAALIKAVLNRRGKVREVKRDMDPKNTNEGYALGKMMAVLEIIQAEAMGDPNASVIDRYFGGASATPKAVFVRLLKNARHHVRKMRDDDKKAGKAFLLDRLLDELASPFDPKDNGFPSHLSLDDQGLFVIGYHHMRKWLWMTNEERAAWQEAYSDAPRAYIWHKDK